MFRPILLSGGRYSINLEGVVRGPDGRSIPHTLDEDGDYVVWIELWNGMAFYKVAMLSIVAFKNNRHQPNVWDKIIPLYRDSDPSNLHPSNLIYRYPPGTTHPEFTDHYCIPLFSSYAIKRNGDLLNCKTGKYLNSSSDKNGYVSYALYPDVGKSKRSQRWICRHRLLCFAFKEYDASVEKLDVNHIDCIPGRDDLDNLEWSTRAANIRHAFENGLRTDNHPILMRNVFTGEVTEFFSISECSRELGLSTDAARFRLSRGNQKIFPGGYQFKRKVDLTPWRIPENPEEELRSNGYPLPVLVKNVFTGEVKEYVNVTDAAKTTGINTATVFWQLKHRNTPRPIHGYLFKRPWDTVPWSNYTATQLQLFKDSPKGKFKPVVIHDTKTGVDTPVGSIKKAAERFSLSIDQIVTSLKYGYLMARRYRVSNYEESPLNQ